MDQEFVARRLEHRAEMAEMLSEASVSKCPHCGFTPDVSDEDFIYPYRPDWTRWIAVCPTTAGGCDAEVFGSSPKDVLRRWNLGEAVVVEES